MYQTFIRTWYKKEYNQYSKRYELKPHIGRKTFRGMYSTEEEARAACRAYNDAIKGSNPLSRKMEYQRV